MEPAPFSGGNGLRRRQADKLSVTAGDTANFKLTSPKEWLCHKKLILTTQTDKQNSQLKID